MTLWASGVGGYSTLDFALGLRGGRSSSIGSTPRASATLAIQSRVGLFRPPRTAHMYDRAVPAFSARTVSGMRFRSATSRKRVAKRARSSSAAVTDGGYPGTSGSALLRNPRFLYREHRHFSIEVYHSKRVRPHHALERHMDSYLSSYQGRSPSWRDGIRNGLQRGLPDSSQGGDAMTKTGGGGPDHLKELVRSVGSQVSPKHRYVRPQNLRMALRAVLDLPETLGIPLDPEVSATETVLLDVDAWLVWVEVGLGVFATAGGDSPEENDTKVPSLPLARAVTTKARSVVLALAMERFDGNITRAAGALEISRRALREHLRTTGLYPWNRDAEQDAQADASVVHPDGGNDDPR